MAMAMADKLDPEAADAGSAMTEIELTDGYRLEADVIASDATGRPLLAPDKNQLADVGKGALMDNAVCEMTSPGTSASVNPSILSSSQVAETTGKVATVKQPVACLPVWRYLQIQEFLHIQSVEPNQWEMTENELTDGYRLEADVIASDATGRPLLAPDNDQLPDEGKGALMDNAVCEMTSPGTSVSVNPSILSARLVVEMTGKVATVKQPVACLEVSSDSGISAYSKRGTKSMGSPLRDSAC